MVCVFLKLVMPTHAIKTAKIARAMIAIVCVITTILPY